MTYKKLLNHVLPNIYQYNRGLEGTIEAYLGRSKQMLSGRKT